MSRRRKAELVDPTDATITQCVIAVDDPASLLQRFDGRSCLWWLLREFSRFGVTDFLLLTGQMPLDMVDCLPCRVRITFAPPAADAGTGGALLGVRDRLQQRFLWCAGPHLFDWNLAALLAAAATDRPATIGRIARFDGPASGVIAVFRKAVLDHLRPGCTLLTDMLPTLISHDLIAVMTVPGWRARRAGAVQAIPAEDQAIPAADQAPGEAATGTPSAHNPLRRRGLFLDRDGVLNIDHGYIGSRDRFEWTDGALAAIHHATAAGWHVFIVTNQSGVARGLYTEDAVRDLLRWIGGQARAAGGTIDDVRFCPYHPQAVLSAYRRAHPWRKPLPGMLLDLIDAWALMPGQAVMIGDQDSDMRAAAAAGVAGHRFSGGNLLAFLRPILDQPLAD